MFLERIYRGRWRPDIIAATISDIDFKQLAEAGVCHALLDLDGSLIPGNAAANHSCPGEPSLKKAQDDGHLRLIGIISNVTVASPHLIKRVSQTADRFSCKHHCCFVSDRKPKPGGFRALMRKMGPEVIPENSVMIGDQLFTDVAGARRLGMRSVLIISRLGGDNLYLRLFKRPLETLLLRIYDGERYRAALE